MDEFIENFDVGGLPDDWRSLTELSIRLHNKLTIPDTLTEREALFSNLLRDADKVDIFRVIAEIPYKDRSSFKDAEQRDCARDEIMQCVLEHRCVPRTFERSKFESTISQCCMGFELVYQKSKELTRVQGYLAKMIANAREAATEKESAQLNILENELHKSFNANVS